MSNTTDEREATILSPDDAFAVLGDETRMEILQTLGEADEALSFSALRDRVGVRDSGQFNYHLGKLEGHFVRKTDEGYTLRQAGRRVVEAVLSGAVTDAPVVEPTPIEKPCNYCGTPILVSYREETVRTYCTECAGTYGDSVVEDPANELETLDMAEEYSYLGELELPAAGVYGRTPMELVETAMTWACLVGVSTTWGICPRCSARLEDSVRICEEHDSIDGLCDKCHTRHAVMWRTDCTNCIFERRAPFVLSLLANIDVLAFLTTHGVNPIKGIWEIDWDAGEEIISVEPFEARFTITVGDATLTVTVDDDWSVVDVTETRASESG